MAGWCTKSVAVVVFSVLLQGMFPTSAEAQTHPPCRQPWTSGLRRPERFTLVERCVRLTGVVESVRAKADGDLHIQLKLLNHKELLNRQNSNKQNGYLVVEIEPWQRGLTTKAIGAPQLPRSSFCAKGCNFKAGEHIRITSTIVTDREHGWNEAHSPSNIRQSG